MAEGKIRGKNPVETLPFPMDKLGFMHMGFRIDLRGTEEKTFVVHTDSHSFPSLVGGKVEKNVDNFNLDSAFF